MRYFILLGGVAAAIVCLAPKAIPQQDGKQAAPAATPHKALLDRYCVGCHNSRTKTANLALDALDLAHPEKDALTWERAIRKLRGGMMPPPGLPKPPAAEVNAFATYLEDSLDRASAANFNPGAVRIHRLNRSEYQNAARDLLAVEINAEALLPVDDISDGFDNIARALKVSPSFLDQYIMAARAVVRKAIGTPPSSKEARATVRGIDPEVPLPPGARSGITARHLFAYEGDYEIRSPGPAAVFTIDGKPVDTTGRMHLTAGYHTIVMANPGRSLIESEGALYGFVPGAAGTGYQSTGTSLVGGVGGGGRGGRGGAAGVTVNGPFNPVGEPVENPSRTRIFICKPPAQSEETACAARILTNLAAKAYRRPVTDADIQPLLRFFREARSEETFEAGIESALVAMLSSSKYLYRVEAPPSNARPGTAFQLGGRELASRLSFFLWSSLPDEELLTVAEQGKLSDPKILEAQVRRMLADPRSKTLTTNFAFSWLKVRDMDQIEPDPFIFPYFDGALRAAFTTEAEMFIDSIFREDHSVIDLLNADYTFANERLAAHYNIPNVRGDHFRRVKLEDANRWGILGKGAVLLVTAYPNRTSPVLRGAYVLEHLLGTPPAPPPPNVEAFQENKEGEKQRTIREILETHRANPTCNSCHGVMDPLGFALESFDTIATYRTMDKWARVPIDASGKLVDGTTIDGPVDLQKALLARGDQFAQTFAERLMTYALGRGVEYYDMPTIRKIVRESKRDNYKFSSIVLSIVNAPAFQSSAVEAAKAE